MLEGQAGRRQAATAWSSSRDGIKIEPADDLVGLGNYDTVARQFEEFGDKVTCLSIGPAGEMRAAAATIAVTDVEGRPTRHCGRGGLGAVMGSKGVKVIVVDPAGGAAAQAGRPGGLQARRMRKFNEALQKHPLTGQTPARRTAPTPWPT